MRQMDESSGETPWAQVKRMRGEGASFEAVVAALQARGLPADDIELLLEDLPDFRADAVPRAERQPPAETAPAADGPAFSFGAGSGFRWFLVFVASVAAAASGWWSSSAPSPAAGASLAAALAALVALLAAEFRLGLRRTTKRLAFVLFFVCIAPALGGVIGGWGPYQVVSAALFLGSVPLLVWSSVSGPKLKGVADFGAGDVFEHGDVQFAIEVPERPTLAVGEALEVRVRAQSCVRAKRELVVELHGDTATLSGERAHAFTLEPGAVVEAVIPFRFRALSHGRVTVVLGVHGRGADAGPRLRLDKGAEYVSPSDALGTNLVGLATLATVGFGAFRLGSNGAINVKMDPDKPAVTTESAPAVKTLYAPSDDELERAARS